MSYAAIFAMLGIFLIPFILVWLVCYGLEAYALYTLAQNNGHNDKAILAFVPYIQVPTIASAGVIALLPLIGGYFGGIIFILCTVVTIIVSYYNYKAVYSKMSNISDSNLFAILASVISLCRIIFVFSHKNDIFVEDGEYVEE